MTAYLCSYPYYIVPPIYPVLNFAELHDIQLIIPGSLYSNSQQRHRTMSYQTETVQVCHRCTGTSAGSYGPITPCGRGPLMQIGGNTEDSCYGVEPDEEEVPIGMCQNCRILEAREREWEQANDSDDEEMEGVYSR
ncbi:hypothetical protein FOVG_14146 [Fusarium oxysporum f. sp. pisi HDV247]|uniref:Uncharacterized protein n=1 Tax=Fusarium oxysporum f. sp. pisi HDV247 TaxID=1080344 RepID=W9NPK5_FUSOX|nr:hypothetical protein FOVG_14146 [Fusarium oxysporum f. sp. pisi HDV247]